MCLVLEADDKARGYSEEGDFRDVFRMSRKVSGWRGWCERCENYLKHQNVKEERRFINVNGTIQFRL